MLGQTPPIEFAPSAELDENGMPTGVLCTETLHSQYIELSKPNDVKLVTDFSRSCDGRALVRQPIMQVGSFVLAGATVKMTVEVGGVVSSHNFTAIKAGRRLSVLSSGYTEDDPDGSSGGVFVHSIYEAR